MSPARPSLASTPYASRPVPRAEWLLLAVLPALVAWRSVLFTSNVLFVVYGMSRWERLGCFVQDVLLWSLLYGGLAPLVRRYGRAAAGLAIAAANVAVLFQMIDVRCKLLFMQPLTWTLLASSLREAGTLYSSLPFFLGKRLWIAGLGTLGAVNAAMLLGPRLLPRAHVALRLAPRAALFAAPALNVVGYFVKPQPYHIDDNMVIAPAVHAARASAEAAPDHGLAARCDQPARVLGDDDLASRRDPAAALARGRNVVIFLAESMTYGDSSLGDPAADTTPFLRELAAYGPITTSSRPQIAMSTKAIYSTLTGRYASPTLEILESLADRLDSLPRMLKKEGYYSAFISTQYLYWQGVTHQYEAMGFDAVVGARELRDLAKKQGREPMGNSYGVDDLELERGVLDTLPTDRPFLAVLYTSAPHHPYEYDGHHQPGTYLEKYRRALSYTDRALRGVADELKKRGQFDKTLFVVLGDHGEHFDHGEFTTRGCSMTEDEYRIPLVFAAPGLPAKARIDVKGARQIDVVPTVLDLLGVSPEAPLQGRSLLDGKAPPPVYIDGYGECEIGGMIEGDDKYVYDMYARRGSRFDLVSDPRGERAMPIDAAAEARVVARVSACRQYNEDALRALAKD